MANIKSAKKRIKVIERKSAENRVLKSALKTQLKNLMLLWPPKQKILPAFTVRLSVK